MLKLQIKLVDIFVAAIYWKKLEIFFASFYIRSFGENLPRIRNWKKGIKIVQKVLPMWEKNNCRHCYFYLCLIHLTKQRSTFQSIECLLCWQQLWRDAKIKMAVVVVCISKRSNFAELIRIQCRKTWKVSVKIVFSPILTILS